MRLGYESVKEKGKKSSALKRVLFGGAGGKNMIGGQIRKSFSILCRKKISCIKRGRGWM